MKILITGGLGFIGSNLVESLKQQHQIEIFDKGKYRIDYCKRDYDTIIHLAAITDTTFKPDDKLINMNTKLFLNILKHAKKINADLIYASSAAVYGNGRNPMKENQKLQPLNAYAESKAIIDEVAKKEMDNIKIIGLRFFNVYGPNEKYKGKSASMIWQLRQQILASEPKYAKLFEYGEQKRDHIYIKDVVSSITASLKSPHSGIYNIGTGVATTFNQLLEYINSALGTSAGVKYVTNPYESSYQTNTQADITLARKCLKWGPKWSLQDGIKDYFSKILLTNQG